MSKNIAISDDVYERLKREKGDRSFSELLAETLDNRTRLADVSGAGVVVPETHEDVKADIAELSQGTFERLEDETP